MPPATTDVLVIGGGPAGLRAAELTSAAGLRTVLADRMRSVGRKFLVAGRGGLNLTHSEPLEDFLCRYGEPQHRWRDLLDGFSPQDLRAWAEDLGIETFIGTSRRVFPIGKHAAPLLRRWIERLRTQGVSFRARHQLTDLARDKDDAWAATFEHEGQSVVLRARTIILALGGASWPQTGSDGSWTHLLARMGIPLAPLAPANCGYEVEWTPEFLALAEGRPLKNIVISAAGISVAGELLITKYGLEGGALYQLGPVLRVIEHPGLTIDLKPSFTEEKLMARIGPSRGFEEIVRALRLGPVAIELLRARGPFSSPLSAVQTAKALALALRGSRPIVEAISTAGGVAWDTLDSHLMITRHPGLFCAGEMIDWEAPTGGYLLQGCFSTGTRAAQGAITFVKAPAYLKSPT